MTFQSGEARFSPGAVKVDLGRAGIVAAVLGVVLIGGLAGLSDFLAVSAYATLDSTPVTVTVIVSCLALLFTVPFVLILVALPAILRPRGFIFDARGVHHWQGKSWMLLPWEEVAATGIGYTQPPNVPGLSLSIQDAIIGYTEDKIKDALKLDGKRSIAFEIFPVRPEIMERYPLLAGYRREMPPPFAGLSAVRWRVPLPPVIGVARRISHGAQTFQPQRWLGWFARPWRGGLNLGGTGR